jgi:hypothetical protein
MPKIRYEGFDLIIRTNDHGPAHVHVIRGNGELVFVLGGADGEEPELDRVLSPMKKSDARNAFEAVKASQKELLEMWRAIHE